MVDPVRSPKTAAALEEAMACARELGQTDVAERLFAIYQELLKDYRSHRVSRARPGAITKL